MAGLYFEKHGAWKINAAAFCPRQVHRCFKRTVLVKVGTDADFGNIGQVQCIVCVSMTCNLFQQCIVCVCIPAIYDTCYDSSYDTRPAQVGWWYSLLMRDARTSKSIISQLNRCSQCYCEHYGCAQSLSGYGVFSWFVLQSCAKNAAWVKMLLVCQVG